MHINEYVDDDVLSVDRETDQEPEHDHAVKDDDPALTKVPFGVFGLKFLSVL
jgi:hypothetical protein